MIADTSTPASALFEQNAAAKVRRHVGRLPWPFAVRGASNAIKTWLGGENIHDYQIIAVYLRQDRLDVSDLYRTGSARPRLRRCR
jgi:hypothetical protein